MEQHEAMVKSGRRELFVVVRGAGPPVVLLHGLFGTHADFDGMSRALVNEFAVITPDLRGRGRSSPVREVDQHKFEEHAHDVSVVLDHLGLDRVVMGGASFGAAVAVAVTLRHPERVRALLLLQSAFGPSLDAVAEGDLDAYRVLGDRIAQQGASAVADENAARSGSPSRAARWTQHDERSLVAWLRAVPRYRPMALWDDLAAVDVPVLVVPGQDAVHTHALSERYAAALPRSTLIEAPPRELGTIIRQWLRNLTEC